MPPFLGLMRPKGLVRPPPREKLPVEPHRVYTPPSQHRDAPGWGARRPSSLRVVGVIVTHYNIHRSLNLYSSRAAPSAMSRKTHVQSVELLQPLALVRMMTISGAVS
jgi:hypothetical protein